MPEEKEGHVPAPDEPGQELELLDEHEGEEAVGKSQTDSSESADTPPPLPPSSVPAAAPVPPVRTVVMLSTLAIIITFDALLYRGCAGAGYAVLLGLVGFLLYASRPEPGRLGGWLCPSLLGLLAIRTVWQSDSFTLWLGFFVLFALAAKLAGHSVWMLDLVRSCFYTVLGGPLTEIKILMGMLHLRWLRSLGRLGRLSVLVPLLVMGLFLGVFWLANPILASWLAVVYDAAVRFIENFAECLPTFAQILFWLFSGLIAAILLCPREVLQHQLNRLLGPDEDLDAEEHSGTEGEGRYAMARNTLISVSLLFLAYSCIDVYYLWIKHSLPKGISYSAYAINGTIWLTVALALTSLVIGVIFSSRLNFHEKTPLLKKLTWFWAIENLLLAAFAYRRLGMYIGFNGLTRWRTVGAFGITLVIIGLVIVVRKVQRKHTFLWMVRRQLGAFALALFFLLIFPMDFVAHAVNARQVLKGELGPAYQIADQPLTAEALPPLLPLLEVDDLVVREGVAGILLREYERLHRYNHKHPAWVYSECSRSWALRRIEEKLVRIHELIPDREWRKPVRRLQKYTEPYKWPGRPERWNFRR